MLNKLYENDINYFYNTLPSSDEWRLFKEFQNLEFVPIDLNNNYKGLYGLLNLFRKLKKNKVKSVVDLHGVLRTKILNLLFKFTFTRVKSINKGRSERKKLIRKKNKIFKPLTQVLMFLGV